MGFNRPFDLGGAGNALIFLSLPLFPVFAARLGPTTASAGKLKKSSSKVSRS